MPVDEVRNAYGLRADEYADLAVTAEWMAEPDHKLITHWAAGVSGRMIDAGCGPGQWTDVLRGRGCDVEGVDLTPEFVAIARSRFPDTTFRVGELTDLGVDDGSVAGILSWYSVIHTSPGDVPRILAEFARCLRDGGSLLLGMFEGPQVEPFDHAVTTAWFWPVDQMSQRLADAGFVVEETESRAYPGRRSHAAIIARRVRG